VACHIAIIYLLRGNFSLALSTVSWLLSFYLYLLTCLLSRTMLNWRRLKVLVRWIRWIIILSGVWVVVRVMKNYVRWKPLNNPFMLQSFIRGETLLWIPLEASTNKIDEWRIGHLSKLVHDVSQSFLFLIIGQNFERCRHGIIFELGKELLSLRVLKNLLGWHANYIDYQLQLLFFIRAGE